VYSVLYCTHTLKDKERIMFRQYFVYYDGCFVGTVMALSEQSAKDKGAQMCGVSASAYTGKARRLVQVERSIL